MPGSLVISLDFELMWGVRDHRSVADYGDAVMGGRAAIPQMLDRFRRAQINATWATVGLLFAQSRDEMRALAPRHKPRFANPDLSPYTAIDTGAIGRNEAEDPLHFGASLIDQIADTPGQEIASHSFSHFNCLEPGADTDAFDADLTAARVIAAERGHALRSLVFPRNQYSADHVGVARENGLGIYRGTSNGWLYRARPGAQVTRPLRMLRVIDGALPLSQSQTVWPRRRNIALDVPASRFLRPYMPRLGVYNDLHIRRIVGEMRAAAKAGGIYHLWWHPHNFGRQMARNLARLDLVIAAFAQCRLRYGMESRTMAQIADHQRAGGTLRSA